METSAKYRLWRAYYRAYAPITLSLTSLILYKLNLTILALTALICAAYNIYQAIPHQKIPGTL